MSGRIPPDLGMLANLLALNFAENQLSGETPHELGSLSKLTYVRLGGNEFTGCIPEGLQPVPDSGLPRLDLAFCSAQTSVAPQVSEDRAALVALHNATGGPGWRSHTNWLSDSPIGDWHGVTTDDSGRVTELSLERNQLTGELPPELGYLTELTRLWLNSNELSG